jgi:hypothetical protein
VFVDKMTSYVSIFLSALAELRKASSYNVCLFVSMEHFSCRWKDSHENCY